MRTVVGMALLILTTGLIRAETLIGTQVSGELYFNGYLQNFFDPANGFVPAGYLNVAGTTVTISSTAVEFGYSDPTATVTADLAGSQLVVVDHPTLTGNYNSIRLVFTDSGFSSLSPLSDNFPHGGMTASLSGGAVTLNWAGGFLANGQTLQAVFNVTPIPEPSTFALTWLSVAGLVGFGRRR